jgi:choline dehydrogenase
MAEGTKSSPVKSGTDFFDYIIVGAGTAGCILANRLTASGRHRVLMLEAGGEPRGMWIPIPAGFSKLLNSPVYNWRFCTEPEANTLGRVISVPRGKGLGGSSLINGMIYVRGQPADYDAWERAGARGWSYADVEPYFRKVERFGSDNFTGNDDASMRLLRVRQRFPISHVFLQAAVEDGQVLNEDYNAGVQDGFGYYQVTQHRGRRWSVVDGYLKSARRRKNLYIEKHSRVLRLNFSNNRCIGVTYRQYDRDVTVRANVEVLLSAGTVQSPQVLELSGVGRPSVLQPLGVRTVNPLQGVGENYIDHFATRMNWRLRNTVSLNEMSRGWRLGLACAEYLIRRTGILTLGPGLVHGFVRTRPESSAPDGQFFFVNASYANAAERVLDKAPGMTIGVSQLRPESSGSIHASTSDPFAAPSIRPNFLASAVDQACLIRSMQIARRIVGRPAMQPYIECETSPGSQTSSDAEWLEFARANGQTIYHPIGTCRMGEDENAVVDSRLRLRGMEGLRVVDASVIPQMVSGNIQAAVMAVAEKASDMILEDAVRANKAHGNVMVCA